MIKIRGWEDLDGLENENFIVVLNERSKYE